MERTLESKVKKVVIGGAVALAGCGSGYKSSSMERTAWHNGIPSEISMVVRDSEEYFRRSREFFSYFDDSGKRESMIFFEERIPNSNKWRLYGVSGLDNGRLVDRLAERFPKLAEFLMDKSIGINEVSFEDVYEDNKLREIKVYLPNGESEAYSIKKDGGESAFLM